MHAHANDVLARAYDRGRSPPSDDELSRQVALCLRASGYDRHEMGRALRSGRSAGGPSGDPAVEGALDRAFSPSATAWLDARPGYRARASRVSDRAVMDTYRRIRSAAMARLRRHLDEVWATRRADVDRLMARHRADMASLRDLGWRNRRLQNRDLVLAVLSIMVELAVLRPMMALTKVMTAQERRELDDAARVATERLRALREEWRAAHGIIRGPRARRDGPEPQPGGAARGLTSEAVAMEGEPPRPGDDARALSGNGGATTTTGRLTISGSRSAASAGSTPAASEVGGASMRKPVGQAGREPDEAVAPRISHLLPGQRMAAGAESIDIPSTATSGAVSAPRAAQSEAVEAIPARAVDLAVSADQAASGPAQPALATRSGPASSSRDGEGRRPDGSSVQGRSDGAVALPPGSKARSVPELSEARSHPAAAPPLRPKQQGADIELVVSTMLSLELFLSAARPVSPGNGEGSAGQHGKRKGPRPEPAADVRRHLVVRYALVLAACNAWSDHRKRRLAALAPVDPGRLWGLAHDECRARFGHGKLSTIEPSKVSDLLDAVLREADLVGFVALAELRHVFLREQRHGREGRGGRGDDPREL